MTTGSSLILLGAASIIAAIVRGGFKLSRTEFPTIASVRRQILLALFGAVLIVGGWMMDRPAAPTEMPPQEAEVDTGPSPQTPQTNSGDGNAPRNPWGQPTEPPPSGEGSQPLEPDAPELPPAPRPAQAPPPCEPRLIDQPAFTLAMLASGGYRLTAPAGQCPAAGIGESLIVEIELCAGRASTFSSLAPDFQAYDRNGSRLRSQVELGVATAGPNRRYGSETRSGRQNPRFATGAAYARLALHGRGRLRDVAPQLCAIGIR